MSISSIHLLKSLGILPYTSITPGILFNRTFQRYLHEYLGPGTLMFFIHLTFIHQYLGLQIKLITHSNFLSTTTTRASFLDPFTLLI